MSDHRIFNKSSITDVTSGTGNVLLPETLKFTPRFLVGSVLLNLKFSMQCKMFVDKCLYFFFRHCIICPSNYVF